MNDLAPRVFVVESAQHTYRALRVIVGFVVKEEPVPRTLSSVRHREVDRISARKTLWEENDDARI